MSALVVLPLVVVALGTAAVAAMVRRLTASVHALDLMVGTLGRLEASRVELEREVSTAATSVLGARVLGRHPGR